jgi:hypothetical protein
MIPPILASRVPRSGFTGVETSAESADSTILTPKVGWKNVVAHAFDRFQVKMPGRELNCGIIE